MNAASARRSIHVAIVGGGIGGLCLAIGLLKLPHIHVQLYEAAHQFKEIGAGVAFGPNSQRAMRLISPCIYEAYMKEATCNVWEEHKNSWFQILQGQGRSEGELITTVENEGGQSTVHRAHFLDELVKLLPQHIGIFGKRLEKIEDDVASGIKLHFRDGTTATVDALIGADGVHSITRQFLLGDHPATKPVFTRSVAYRGLVPMDTAITRIGARFSQNSYLWIGKDRNVMTYPIDHGETLNVVAWNAASGDWDTDDWVVPADPQKIAAEFAGWGETTTAIIKMLDTPKTAAWSLWEHPPAPYYAKGHVCMMGDAAHTSTPFQGAGAGQAIEDALVLANLLAEIEAVEQIEAAFAAFDRVRRFRSQEVVRTSREAGEILAMRFKGIGEDTEKIRDNYNERMNWIWNKDLEAQTLEAVTLMKAAYLPIMADLPHLYVPQPNSHSVSIKT